MSFGECLFTSSMARRARDSLPTFFDHPAFSSLRRGGSEVLTWRLVRPRFSIAWRARGARWSGLLQPRVAALLWSTNATVTGVAVARATWRTVRHVFLAWRTTRLFASSCSCHVFVALASKIATPGRVAYRLGLYATWRSQRLCCRHVGGALLRTRLHVALARGAHHATSPGVALATRLWRPEAPRRLLVRQVLFFLVPRFSSDLLRVAG